jgi:hypothetical protein
MENNKYNAAFLPENLVDEIKTFEEKLRKESDKNVVVIAYEKGTEDSLA